MNWLEKVKFLINKSKSQLPDDQYFYDVNPKEVTWEICEVENIHSKYSWLSKDYILFLKQFDGITIAFCRFYGSKKGIAIKLSEELSLHEPRLKNKYFPFGSDADGSIFLFDKKGRVLWWDIEDYNFEQEPKLIAGTFEEFVGECLLGKRFYEFISPEKSKFYQFLQHQDWI